MPRLPWNEDPLKVQLAGNKVVKETSVMEGSLGEQCVQTLFTTGNGNNDSIGAAISPEVMQAPTRQPALKRTDKTLHKLLTAF